MATDKQIQANRRNARKSTGPKTEEGKARSRNNALRHGLTAELAVLPHEDPHQYEELRAGFIASHNARKSDRSFTRCAPHFDLLLPMTYSISSRTSCTYGSRSEPGLTCMPRSEYPA